MPINHINGNGTAGVKSELDDFLFDPQLLSKLNFKDSVAGVSPMKLDANLKLRPLRRSDFQRGYMQLLAQLTNIGSVDEVVFCDQFDSMKSCPNHYFVVVIEDLNCGKIVATASLVNELKFVHSAGLRGRMEDVVVNGEGYRGKKLGQLLVETIKLLARQLNVYKLSLDCKDKMIPYYSALGFQAEASNSNTLKIRYSD